MCAGKEGDTYGLGRYAKERMIIMSTETLDGLRGALKKVGAVRFSEKGVFCCEGMVAEGISMEEALEAMQNAWNDLRTLLPEVYKLHEDYRRLRYITQKSAVSMLCDAQSSSSLLVVEDWWQSINQ